MSSRWVALPECLAQSPVRVVFGPGRLAELGAIARDERAGRVLLVTDPGLVKAGHAEHAAASLTEAGLDVTLFDGTRENPTTEHVDAGLAVAREAKIDFLVAVGGGSAMDCAKGVNILLTNGGAIADYWGVDKTSQPMLPSICVPTTAGTGSEGQSFALISDAQTHRKMACGDRRDPCAGGLRPRVAILDPELTATQPREVAIAAGIDAISHAVESAATTARTDISRMFSRQAWRHIEPWFQTVIEHPEDAVARSHMLLGAHLAGVAIEYSMLGAAHACANPLTARYGTPHGMAVGVMLPHVVRFNTIDGDNPYADLSDDAEALIRQIESLRLTARLPVNLSELGVPQADLPALAQAAAEQWTASFNPRQVSALELLEIYRQAYGDQV
jgi:alcohol dehydrogenase